MEKLHGRQTANEVILLDVSKSTENEAQQRPR